MSVRFASEQELARSIVAWLHNQHWEVYQEVSTGYSAARADIVAVQGKLSWIIETKTTLSLSLLAQAADWIGHANFVSVAVPGRRRRGSGYEFALRLLRERGIGLIEVDATGYVSQVAPRKVRRINGRAIAEILCEGHKTMAEAGSARGGYYTPFAATCRTAHDFVQGHPGCTMRELVDGIEHHYGCDATARSCLGNWSSTNKIPGLERRHEGGKWRLYAEEGRTD